ncbi:enoyl-CoA hydratase [Comamonas testosteroni]|uniref:Enoyl-CoA hydratase n=1 Tax=Comamonas testosteroni TaxID=285 RepID=A0A5A7MKR3_COMTE|nr:enoyl-CoA hydratase [Comamonas testosteroni]GEQ77484.1 enoyl-CoA hydratase [Comamonas testosteroni]
MSNNEKNVEKTVLIERRGQIAVVTLNRPTRMNGIVKQLEFELRDAIESLDRDPGVRAIVLTGAGRAFCAGMDMEQVGNLGADDIRDVGYMRPFDMNRRPDYQTRYSYFAASNTPIIVAINGATAGLGLVLALYADVRFASENAVFATAFAQRGLIAEHGVAWILSHIAGQANAVDLLISSRKINAAEALRMGIVNKVVPHEQVLDEAIAYATQVAETVSPRSVRVMKRQIWEANFQSLGEAIAYANEEMWHSFQQPDFKEGVAHFVEKRKPRFTQV